MLIAEDATININVDSAKLAILIMCIQNCLFFLKN